MLYEFDSDRPIYLQIASVLQSQILSGEYPPGSKLPTVRAIAVEAGININTAHQAFRTLEQSKLITAKGRLGRFVTQDKAFISEQRTRQAAALMQKYFDNMESLGIDSSEVASMAKQLLY